MNLINFYPSFELCNYIECMMNDEINGVVLAVEMTAAWLANPNTRADADDVPAFLISMHSAVLQLSEASTSSIMKESPQTYKSAVTVRKSLASHDHIISLIDGKPYRTLRRHLSTHGLTPDEYRRRYNLKADYPMVAPSYSEARRTLARSIGLGRKPSRIVEKVTRNASKPSRKPRVTKFTEQA